LFEIIIPNEESIRFMIQDDYSKTEIVPQSFSTIILQKQEQSIFNIFKNQQIPSSLRLSINSSEKILLIQAEGPYGSTKSKIPQNNAII
jgi:hypothetical protein